MKKITKHLIAAALASFMLTGTYGTASAATVRTSTRQTTCSNASYMSDFIRYESRKFPTGKYWNGGGDSGITSKPSTSTSPQNRFDADMIYESGNAFYHVNSFSLSASLCEGFARKLSADYYGTSTFLTLWQDKMSVDMIQPGDIIGYQNGSTSSIGHTIFVLSVSGDTITFADCNMDNRCGIRWGAKINKKDLGTLIKIIRPLMIGDTNFDGKVDKKDLVSLNTYIDEKEKKAQGKISSYSMSSYELEAISKFADFNNDNKIDTVDYNLLSIYVDPAVPSDRNVVSQYFCYAIYTR